MLMSRTFAPRLSTDAAEAPDNSTAGALPPALPDLARPSASGADDARERYLSRSVDHEDFERRMRTWDAHEARLRNLPPVL